MVVAADASNCIGRDGELPWRLPSDLAHFKELTTGNVCLAGATTHESIVRGLGRPLPKRITIVVSRKAESTHASVIVCRSVELALDTAIAISEFAGREEVFVIGGLQTYQQLLPRVNCIYLTRIHARYVGDTYLPHNWLDDFTVTAERQPNVLAPEESVDLTFQTYERRS